MTRDGLLLLLLLFPASAHAQVLIQEIMYAPEGADADREWIEVCNTGDTTVSLDGWKLHENDTNHSLSLVLGSAQLDTNACAIIADDAVSFQVDYPAFSGNVFDSAFSLKNTGETLILKSDTGSEVDTVAYSDTMGAKDSGESLHRTGNTFVAASPSPGVLNTQSSTAESTTGNTTVGPSITPIIETLYSYDVVTVQPPEDVHIRTDKTVTGAAGSYTSFEVETYDATGASFQDGVVTWAFGDGGVAHGRRVAHKYFHTGEYTAVARVERGGLVDEVVVSVSIVPVQVQVVVGSRGDWIELHNYSNHDVHVSQWRMVASGHYFQIPQGTIVAANNTVRFPREVTKLNFVNESSNVQLVFPDGTQVPVWSPLDEHTASTTQKSATSTNGTAVVSAPPATQPREIVTATQDSRGVIGMHVSKPTVRANEIHERAEQKQAEMVSTSSAAAVVLSSASDTDTNRSYWYIMLGILVCIVIAAVVLLTPRPLRVHGFEIIEKGDE